MCFLLGSSSQRSPHRLFNRPPNVFFLFFTLDLMLIVGNVVAVFHVHLPRISCHFAKRKSKNSSCGSLISLSKRLRRVKADSCFLLVHLCTGKGSITNLLLIPWYRYSLFALPALPAGKGSITNSLLIPCCRLAVCAK